jgi:peroxidase
MERTRRLRLPDSEGASPAWLTLGCFGVGATLSMGAMHAVIEPVPSLETPDPPAVHEARSFDGRFNHAGDPTRGARGRPYRRLVPFGVHAASADLPSPRVVSNAVHAAPRVGSGPEPGATSSLFAAFGQFLGHDITLRAKRARPRFMRVGRADPMFPPGTLIPFVPNATHPETGGPYNRVTAWIDGSMIYGSDRRRAMALRSFSGGRLRTGPGDQLPLHGLDHRIRQCRRPSAGFERSCLPPLENENPRREVTSTLRLAGDVRANENPLLLSLHTIFLREHNRRAERLAELHPEWTDETLYREARRWTGALVQALTYHEYLPRLLGTSALSPYRGYDPEASAEVSVAFAAVAFRFGHSQLGPTLYRLGPDGREFVNSHPSLKAAFFAPPLYDQAGGGPGAWLLGAARSAAEPIDLAVVDDMRNYMFGNLSGGLDIAAINIQVGRDSLGAGFDALREAVGLEPLSRFEELTSDPETVRVLRRLYGTVDRVDPWVALLAEDPPANPARDGWVGPTLRAVLVEQFEALRDGDRFYFERDPALRGQVEALRQTRLGHVIRRNLRGRWAEATFSEDAFRIPEPATPEG